MTTGEIRPTTIPIGAEVVGVDLRDPTDEDLELVRSALIKHRVVFVPGQFLSEAQLTRVAGFFGPIAPPPPNFNPDSMTPEGQYLLDGAVVRANHWHTDQTYVLSPVWLGILSAEVLPEVGGDTVWSDMGAAYEMLAPELKGILSGLRAEHRALPGSPEMIRTAHPVVAARPHTGKPVLYVNPAFTHRIIGLSPMESRHLLALLYELTTTTPELMVRHRWSPGDLVMWDMRATIHRAIDDYGNEPRILRRISVLGDVPVDLDGKPSEALEGEWELSYY